MMSGLDSVVLGCAMTRIAARKVECRCRVEGAECRRRDGCRGRRKDECRREESCHSVACARLLLSLWLVRVE